MRKQEGKVAEEHSTNAIESEPRVFELRNPDHQAVPVLGGMPAQATIIAEVKKVTLKQGTHECTEKMDKGKKIRQEKLVTGAMRRRRRVA